MLKEYTLVKNEAPDSTQNDSSFHLMKLQVWMDQKLRFVENW